MLAQKVCKGAAELRAQSVEDDEVDGAVDTGDNVLDGDDSDEQVAGEEHV